MGRELIWVSKDLAKRYNELDEDVKKIEFVEELIKQKNIDITSDIQNLDNDLLRFKAFSLNYSTAFKKAYDEQAEKLYQLWEECSEPIEKIDRKTIAMKNEINSLSKDVCELSKGLMNLDTYKLERIIELIESYNRMSEKDKEVFKIILKQE